jgi:ATP synthase protein I
VNKPSPRDNKIQEFTRKIGKKAANKLDFRKEGTGTIWFGLGMIGIIGWAVAVPTLAGIGLGIWLDSRYSGRYSWTLTLMGVGLVLGCLNAWHWIKKEEKEMRKGKHDD